MPHDEPTAELIENAQSGDRAALERVVRAIQGQVFGLCQRMLADPVAAEDACQDVLILVVTRLSTFERRARFRTWVYRIAMNALLSQKRRQSTPQLGFDAYGADLIDGLVDPAPPVEDQILLSELRIGCTMAMLLCLTPEKRAAYVLGDVFELDHAEAAEILDLNPATYRQRLARARAEVVAFTAQSCGVVAATAACSCPRRLPAAVTAGRVGQGASAALAELPTYDQILAQTRTAEAALRTMKAQQLVPRLGPQKDFAASLDRMLAQKHP